MSLMLTGCMRASAGLNCQTIALFCRKDDERYAAITLVRGEAMMSMMTRKQVNAPPATLLGQLGELGGALANFGDHSTHVQMPTQADSNNLARYRPHDHVIRAATRIAKVYTACSCSDCSLPALVASECVSSAQFISPRFTMALHLSKTTKLVLLLTIDILFFLVELIVGKCTPLEDDRAMLADGSCRLQRAFPRVGGRCLSHGLYPKLLP